MIDRANYIRVCGLSRSPHLSPWKSKFYFGYVLKWACSVVFKCIFFKQNPRFLNPWIILSICLFVYICRQFHTICRCFFRLLIQTKLTTQHKIKQTVAHTFDRFSKRVISARRSDSYCTVDRRPDFTAICRFSPSRISAVLDEHALVYT